MPTFHHVNLGIPPDGAEAETAFLVDGLGYRLVVGDHVPPRARWFEGEDGAQIHLSLDPDHRPANLAHVAVVFGDELDAVAERLQERGDEVRLIEGQGFGVDRVVFTKDPAGNRWELRGHATLTG